MDSFKQFEELIKSINIDPIIMIGVIVIIVTFVIECILLSKGYLNLSSNKKRMEKAVKLNHQIKAQRISYYELRKILGSFLFFGDDIFKKVSVLSLGEKSRVALAKISLQGANTLLLDEPTNHLDPMTQLIIAKTFKNYEGTMLVVSHNLDFVDNLGINRMLLLPSGKVMYYDRDIVMYYEQVNKKE